jgi:hypothetical protein
MGLLSDRKHCVSKKKKDREARTRDVLNGDCDIVDWNPRSSDSTSDESNRPRIHFRRTRRSADRTSDVSNGNPRASDRNPCASD